MQRCIHSASLNMTCDMCKRKSPKLSQILFGGCCSKSVSCTSINFAVHTKIIGLFASRNDGAMGVVYCLLRESKNHLPDENILSSVPRAVELLYTLRPLTAFKPSVRSSPGSSFRSSPAPSTQRSLPTQPCRRPSCSNAALSALQLDPRQCCARPRCWKAVDPYSLLACAPECGPSAQHWS